MTDVHHFGATGDGKTDDTAAIEHALKDGEGTLDFPRGDYRITRTIVIDLDKTGFTAFEGHGTARIVMAGKGPALRFVGTHVTGSAAPNSFEPRVWRNQRMPLVDGLEFVGAHPEADAIQVEGAMQFTITRSLITRCRHGIHLVNRNRNIIVSDCHIYHNTGIGIFYDNLSLHQSNIVGTHISYCDGGGIVFRGGDVRNVHVGTCDIESNHSPDGPPTANILIDCSSSPSGTAEVAITGCTIQHNSTSPQSANIRILGRGAEGTHGRQQWGHVAITGNVLSDVATNVHLAGCRDVTLTGNTFWMGFEHDLVVEDCTAIVMAANAFDRNPGYAYGKSATAINAVIFRDSRDCTISGLHVQGVHTAEAAMVVERCERFNIADCTLLDNDHIGLLLRDVKRSRISGCLIRDDREGAKSLALKAIGGGENDIVGNSFGRPTEIENPGGKTDPEA